MLGWDDVEVREIRKLVGALSDLLKEEADAVKRSAYEP